MMKKGFTLIELLVVISIIAILSTIGLAIFSGIQSRARDSIRKNDLNTLATALEIYYQKNGKYIPPADNNSADSCERDTSFFYNQTGGIAKYMSGNIVPKDPTGKNYCYIAVNKGASYRLFAKLENCTDSPLCSYENYNYSLVSEDLTIIPAPGDAKTKPTPCGVVGDANKDSQISAADVTLVTQWVGAVEESLSTDQLKRGDVNLKNGVDSIDALCIRRYINGADSTFGACPDANTDTISGEGCRPPPQ